MAGLGHVLLCCTAYAETISHALTGAVNEVFNGDFEHGDFATGLATWNQRGPGMVIPKTEFSTTVAEFTAGSPIEIYQHVSTLNSAFSVNFDALSLDASGTLSLLLDDVVLQSWTAAELAGTKMQSFSYLVDNPDDWGLIDVPLTFHWEANTGDRVYLDNIRLVNANPDPVVVAPESFETSGVVIRGGLAELLTSDNQKLVVATGATSQTIDVNAISPNESPTQFSFTVESSVRSAKPVEQKIFVFNYDLDDYELVDTRPARVLGDEVVTIQLTGDLSRFVQPATGCIESRVMFTKAGLARGVQAFIDQVKWTIE